MGVAFLQSKDVREFIRKVDPLDDLPDDTVELIAAAYEAGRRKAESESELAIFSMRCDLREAEEMVDKMRDALTANKGE